MKWVRAAAALLFTAGLLSCSTSLKVSAGWDKNVDFSKYYTWSWKEDGSIRDPVWGQRFRSVLTDTLASKKLAPIDTSPDLWAVAHVRLSSETQIVPYSNAWGYGWGAWATAYYPVEYQIPVGTIILDLVDARKKELVWRGSANGALRSNRTNEQREERLTEILAQMFAGYPPGAPGSGQPAPASSR